SQVALPASIARRTSATVGSPGARAGGGAKANIASEARDAKRKDDRSMETSCFRILRRAPAEGMRLGVEDDRIEIESSLRSEEKIEIFQRLGQEVARHQVAFVAGHDVRERRVTRVGAAAGDEG